MRLIGWAALAAGIALAGTATAVELPFDPDQATRAWLDTMGPEATARSNAYFEGGYWIQFVGPLIGFLVAFALLQTGFAKGLRAWLEKSVKVYFFVVLGFALVYSLIGSVVSFPWDYWVGFVREHDYGLSNQNFGQWFTEYLQGAGIGLVVGTLAIGALYLIIAVAKKTWWIWGTVATICFVAFFAMVAPVFISPIFNTYTEMPESPLQESVLQMAQASGVPADNVYVYDRSRQTNSISANVSGLFGTTRISLADTLIERESPAGVRAVLAHEIGHYVLQHIVSLLVMFSLLIVVVYALANLLFNRLSAGERWGIRSIADPAGMPLFFSIIGFVMLLATPIQNNIVRFHESQADIFGLNAGREPDGFAESALLLSEYRKMEPSPLEEWFFYDHPSGHTRIRMAMQWKAHEIAAGRLPPSPGGPPAGWRPDFVVARESGGASPPPETQPTPETPAEPSPGAGSN